MVHNGIEYGDMQLIAEAYDVMRKGLGMDADQMADVFEQWNASELESYLIEITAKILRLKEPETGKPLVDLVRDQAGQKGTGRWTSELALELGVPIPTIDSAIAARTLSSLRDERLEASQKSTAHTVTDVQFNDASAPMLKDALYASKICSYAQGMHLIKRGSEEFSWNINLSEVARIWQGGCIIRAKFLGRIKEAYQRDPQLKSLLLDNEFSSTINRRQVNWRSLVSMAIRSGIPVLAMGASLGYFDMYRSDQLPLNLTQAQRDYFGAHTYERLDKPELGFVHTEWDELLDEQLKRLTSQ
jgi:6-phosphogluconate dehydrogenase